MVGNSFQGIKGVIYNFDITIKNNGNDLLCVQDMGGIIFCIRYFKYLMNNKVAKNSSIIMITIQIAPVRTKI